MEELKELTVQGQAELDHYDPAKGVHLVAVAEAAERYFKKARDATKLYQAVEAKLTEQRRFVLWWDGQEKAKGGRPRKTNNRSVIGLSLDSLGVDAMTVSRWRKKLADDKSFEKALEAAAEKCRRICESDKGQTSQRGASGTGENEWYTPEQYLTRARQVLGEFDLDPASSDTANEQVGAKEYFTKEDDGLSREWHGRVWLNPPYAQPFIAMFVSKMVEEVKAGRVSAAIMVTHNYTDTSWFHEGASVASAICFTRGRVKFVDANGEEAAPTQGQAFVYYGDDVETFRDVFSEIGLVLAKC